MSDQQVAESPKRMANNAELKVLVKALSDGLLLVSDLSDGLSLGDLGDLLKLVRDVPPALSDASIYWPEFKALDDDARADLIAYVQQEVKFPANASVEMIAEEILDGIISLSKLFQLLGKGKVA